MEELGERHLSHASSFWAMGRAVIIFLTWVLFAGAGPLLSPFAQLSEFLKPIEMGNAGKNRMGFL